MIPDFEKIGAEWCLKHDVYAEWNGRGWYIHLSDLPPCVREVAERVDLGTFKPFTNPKACYGRLGEIIHEIREEVS